MKKKKPGESFEKAKVNDDENLKRKKVCYLKNDVVCSEHRL